MNKLKNFGRLVKFEFIRLFRNKFVITFLLLFSIILLGVLLVSGQSSEISNVPIAILTDGKDINEIEAVSILEENYNIDNFIYVDSIEEGRDYVKYNKAVFFIEINSETTPETLIMHHDGYSNASNNLKEYINNEKTAYSYEAIKSFLETYGITINKAYFETISFTSINDSQGWNISSTFVLGVASGLSILILFGLAYSISRDNETSASKILSYMPINSHTFFWSKIVTYLILGIIELIILLPFGIILFNISFQTNFFLILLISIIFLISTICMGIFFSSFKSQIATVLLSTAVILIPLILLSTYAVQGMIMPMKILLYIMPITPFIQLMHGMIFNGIINWWYVLVLFIQAIVYYFVSYFVMRRNLKKN